jgi:SAM-dependent methyltransferase
MAETDCWASWLARLRSGGDPRERRKGFEQLRAWRDVILDNAQLEQGETLLDVGCGEGLVGLGALERGAGTVVFSDISHDLLDFCRDAADELGVLDRCRFLRASAEDVSALEASSVDVVTTRSVLIYVGDKEAAFREFYRLLRPGGRISLFEPINRFARTSAGTWAGYDLAPVSDIGTKIRALYEERQPAASDPMLDFDERDLVDLAEGAGFIPIRMRLEAEIKPTEPRSWDTFLEIAPNPCIPSLAEAMEAVLTADERERLAAHLRPLVEEGRGVWRMALAYVVAVRPG